ncbi:MAG TPA: GT-D fold domain-containing glycosyltransferase [Steroidobacteraceae bacterium]
MKTYPPIVSEDDTLAALAYSSIARFGDGEWRCAVGGGCTSQRPEPKLAKELCAIAANPNGCLVGIPNPFGDCPRRESWMRYTQPLYIQHLSAKGTYHSSFITRPDNAPWIDRPDYWAKVRALWQDKDIVLVSGDKKSITTEMMGSEARTVREVHGPRQHAYAEIDRIEEEVGRPAATVLICLGTAATVLAYRLAKKGVHALDLGHIGMFLKHAGAYRYSLDDMTTPAYRAQLTALHAKRSWGADGAKHEAIVRRLIADYQPATILDYGCGENKLAEALKPIRVSGYDPGVPERASMPKPCDLVICTDVLEHVEPEKLNDVLDHVWRITGKVAYFVISTRPANAILPDGRNAHLSVLPAAVWLEKLRALGWQCQAGIGKDLSVIAEKP